VRSSFVAFCGRSSQTRARLVPAFLVPISRAQKEHAADPVRILLSARSPWRAMTLTAHTICLRHQKLQLNFRPFFSDRRRLLPQHPSGPKLLADSQSRENSRDAGHVQVLSPHAQHLNVHTKVPSPQHSSLQQWRSKSLLTPNMASSSPSISTLMKCPGPSALLKTTQPHSASMLGVRMMTCSSHL